MPHEGFIYFGDSKNAPYGTKELMEVRKLTVEHAEELFDEGAKGLVIACNTATSAAVRVLREMHPDIPIVGIEPAVRPAALFMEHPRVLVMATPMTIREEKFHSLMACYEKEADIIPLACPGLMDFIERGDTDGDDLHRYLVDLLYSYSGNKVDAAVLGCTHYPFVRRQIAGVLGDRVRIFDGGEGTAREMRRRIEAAGLLRKEDRSGSVEFRNSLDDEAKISLCRRLYSL
jgi:glutamate racemase